MPNFYMHEDVAAVRELYADILYTDNAPITYLQACAEHLYMAHKTGQFAAYVELKNGHPMLLGKNLGEITSYALSHLDALKTVAILHGFKDWIQVEQHAHLKFNEHFENAVDLLVSGELDQLKTLINRYPELIKMVSPFGHRANLLHYALVNGVEIRRQIVPENLVDILRFILDLGISKKQTMNAYGKQLTPAQLANSCSHIETAGLKGDILKLLKS